MSYDRFIVRAWDGGKMILQHHIEELYSEEFYPTRSGLVWMQCTGLKDKNKKLMFESDRVIYADHGDWDKAYYGDSQGRKPIPEVIKWNPHNLALGPDGSPFGGNSEYYEIVGHMYE